MPELPRGRFGPSMVGEAGRLIARRSPSAEHNARPSCHAVDDRARARDSSTEILLGMAANMVEPPEGAPPRRHAFFAEHDISSVSLTSPCFFFLGGDGTGHTFGGSSSSSPPPMPGRRPQLVAFSRHSTPCLPHGFPIRIAVGRIRRRNRPRPSLDLLHAVVGGNRPTPPSLKPRTNEGRDQGPGPPPAVLGTPEFAAE